MIRTAFAVLLLAADALLTGCALQAAAPAVPRSSAPRVAPFARSTGVPDAHPVVTRVQVPVNPCAGNHRGQLVRVSLAAQHLWMCDGTHLARGTAITSGRSGSDTATPRGHFHIQGLNRHSTLTLSSGARYDVQYWIPFDAPDFGFHDSPWQRFPYGSAQYRTDGSHGCVHLPLTAIAFLYRWAEIGTRVVIA